MLESQFPTQSLFSWPKALSLEPYQALKSGQVQKVALVGLACILFFGVQLSCSWTMATAVALSFSAITLFSETFFRVGETQNQNWMNPDIHGWRLMTQVALRLSVLPIVLGFVTASGIMPIQAVAVEIIGGNIKIMLLATLLAPIAEEILFRGFIQERMEDLTNLVDRFICPLPGIVKEWLSISVQSLLFGFVHITGEQVVKRAMKIVVFSSVSLLGFGLTLFKKDDESLLSPMAIHSAQNTGVVLGLFMGRYVGRAAL